MYNKREKKISLYEGSEGDSEKSEMIIQEDELYKFIYEINLESFIYFQHFDFAYTLYCLKKAEAVINTYKISETAKSILDEQILVFNNIAFVYSKMGLSEEAFSYCKKILEL
jgi:tetratricopeptide (TPR) repeat protein